jgi:hypothetical protein
LRQNGYLSIFPEPRSLALSPSLTYLSGIWFLSVIGIVITWLGR